MMIRPAWLIVLANCISPRDTTIIVSLLPEIVVVATFPAWVTRTLAPTAVKLMTAVRANLVISLRALLLTFLRYTYWVDLRC